MTAFAEVFSASLWVPSVGLASSFAVADFKTETYTINGVPVTLADMFVQNTDWASFDPAAVIVNGTGLVGDGNNWPTLKSTLAADMIADGVTIKATFQLASIGPTLVFDMLDLPGYAVEITAGNSNATAGEVSDGTTDTVGTNHQLWTGKNVLALNLSETDVSVSPNGYDGFGFDPTDGSPTHIAIQIDSGVTLEKLEFFTLQDRADLYAYSFHGAPHNTTLPVITGTPSLGQNLTCSTGVWDNTPTSFTYFWSRFGPGNNTDTLTLIDGDEGQMVTCGVTAINAEGQVLATTVAVGPVADTFSIFTVGPTVTGNPVVGQTLTVAYTVTNGVSQTRQWRRDGSPIVGQTGATYVLAVADIDTSVDCEVTATNAAGDRIRDSNGIGPVTA